MVKTAQVLVSIRDKVRAIPEVETRLGVPAAAVNCLDDQAPAYRNYTDAITNLQQNEMLVLYHGFVPGFRHDYPTRIHKFSLVTRLPGMEPIAGGGYHELPEVIIAGVPDGETLPFEYLTFDANLDPPAEFAYQPISDANGVAVWALSFTMAEIGG